MKGTDVNLWKPIRRLQACAAATDQATTPRHPGPRSLGASIIRKVVNAALVGTVLAVAAPAHEAAASTTPTKYIVLYKRDSAAFDAAATVARAGGSLVATYPQIGVVIAESGSSSFQSELLKDSGVESAVSTARFGVRAESVDEPDALPADALASFPVDDTQEPLFPLQWNMRQIQVPQAHTVSGGSREVVVGDIDTGLDFTHPDLAPNYDAARSADCSSGAPAPLLPGNDAVGHGTMTAGLIAAAANGIGMIGVAPNVKIAAIKAANADGYFFPEAVVCSFIWAATHGMDVANNSYWADPYYFNCRNDPEQRAIWTAERRAISFALQQGIVVVAAAGNQRDDLAHPTRDVLSPDYPPGAAEERDVSNACAVIPVEVPGVIGVSSVGSLMRKARDSNYGTGVIDVTAPQSTGSQRSSAAPNGLFISTAAPTTPCPVATIRDPITGAKYCYFGGTSAATPQVSGVAALVRSRFPLLPPGAVAALIERTADSIACPDAATLALYAPFPQLSNGEPQTCSGGPASNSWYGHGQVNAARALTDEP